VVPTGFNRSDLLHRPASTGLTCGTDRLQPV
jgi:hypothetical protein